MKKSNKTSQIIILGSIVLIVFIIVSTNIILSAHTETTPYYARLDDNVNANIETIEYEYNRLVITTSGEADSICIKSTRSNPSSNSICFKKVEDNKLTTSIYTYKEYYIWLKDKDGNMTERIRYVHE